MRIDEVVNKQVFNRGFQKEKSWADKHGNEYTLIAKCGPIDYIPSKMNMRSHKFEIEARHNNELAGWVTFEIHGDELRAESVSVPVKYRRRGIASAMYDFAEELGNTLAPSALQKPDGRALWQGRNKQKELNT